MDRKAICHILDGLVTASRTLLQRLSLMRPCFLTALALFYAAFCANGVMAAVPDLEREFTLPPDSTRPRCYWYWVDGHVSKEGITRDLEAMRRVGIGEGYIGIISGQSGLPASGKPKALTDAWWQLIEHAIREAGRLGVDIGLLNSPGWSQSGGPWVKPEQSMRYVVLPEMQLRGPQRFDGKLPAPQGTCQDIAVLAFPAPDGEGEQANISTRTPTAVTWEMTSPFTARSVTVHPIRPVIVTAELQASDDGQQYRTVKRFVVDRHNLSLHVGPVPLAPIVASFPATTARYFRLSFSAACELGKIALSPAARVESYAAKSLLKMFQDPQPPSDFYVWPPQDEPELTGLTVPPETIRNITRHMSADGTLRWDVPSGEWIVIRAVMVPTGVQNTPAPPEATGLEVDKMSRAAIGSHFDAYVGTLLRRMPAADRKALKHIVADSYEVGPGNWTDGFAADFNHRYGYDPIRFLPVMAGRIVGSAEQSNRFLWDLRRLVADRVACEYVGGLRDLCREQGLRMWLENYGHWGFPAEFLQYGGHCDEIGGEFWVSGDLGRVELRDAASAAHIYGMPVVWAEAFTGGPVFQNSPRDLKARGDWAFCQGANQFVLHVYIHQPWDELRPGVNCPFGTEFNRQNTWFEQAKPWVTYLRRCSVMLQVGKPVADVAYFIGEDTPKMTGVCRPALPAGYDFDYINADVIQNRLAVKDGHFILPDGTQYRLLVLPESVTMRPALLKKLRELVLAGGPILGQAPQRSPSLQDFPTCDAEVKQLASELWGGGHMITGTDLTEVFRLLGIGADVICPDGILWKHRKDGDIDIYFLSNEEAVTRHETISFRVNDRAPEFWWPESGRIAPSPAYEFHGGRVRVPVHLDAHSSVFVVFRHKATEGREIDVTHRRGPLQIRHAAYGAVDGAGSIDVTQVLAAAVHHGRLTLLAANDTFDRDPAPSHIKQLRVEYVSDGQPGVATVAENDWLELRAGTILAGPWQVTFDPLAGGPDKPLTFATLDDWSKRPEPGIRYYSGTAKYRATFQVADTGSVMLLNLGQVHAIATVHVNGREVGTVWKQPYMVDISDAVKVGENALEIAVVNTWMNRLIGDQQPGTAKRIAFTTTKTLDAHTPLQPAGLLGPVRIIKEEQL